MSIFKRALRAGLVMAGASLLVAVPPASAQFFHTTNGSIDGSLCVGIDCTSSESFGFDTIRLKENNLRIDFTDTSASASFPNQDWQLVANESANGGLNAFWIQSDAPTGSGNRVFLVEAGARNNALYVENSGEVGIGTNNPVADIHIKIGDTPTLRLEQDGTSGFTPQTWDVAGNETNFFIRDATTGSRLPLRIRAGAPTSSIDVASSGDVGIGTAAPDSKLHVAGGNLKIGNNTETGTRTVRFSNDQNDGLFQNNGTTGLFAIRNASGSVTPFKIETGAPANSLELTAGGVEIEGGTPLPDYVFEPDFELLSIADHAEYMWSRKHLPAVGAATSEGGRSRINVLKHSAGVLEELEIAHIYIHELHVELEETVKELEELKAAVAALTAPTQ